MVGQVVAAAGPDGAAHGSNGTARGGVDSLRSRSAPPEAGDEYEDWFQPSSEPEAVPEVSLQTPPEHEAVVDQSPEAASSPEAVKLAPLVMVMPEPLARVAEHRRAGKKFQRGESESAKQDPPTIAQPKSYQVYPESQYMRLCTLHPPPPIAAPGPRLTSLRSGVFPEFGKWGLDTRAVMGVPFISPFISPLNTFFHLFHPPSLSPRPFSRTTRSRNGPSERRRQPETLSGAASNHPEVPRAAPQDAAHTARARSGRIIHGGLLVNCGLIRSAAPLPAFRACRKAQMDLSELPTGEVNT